MVALGSAAALSQRRETMRLAEKYGDNDDRVRAAEARLQAFTKLSGTLAATVENSGRLVDTVGQDDLFQGYVFTSDGQPASGYTVRLTLEAFERKEAEFTGTTGTDGYFRILLERDSTGGCEPTGDTSAAAVQSRLGAALRDNLGKFGDSLLNRSSNRVMFTAASNLSAALKARSASAETAATTSTTGTQQGTLSSKVEILDPNCKTVFVDPEPPEFLLSNGHLTSDFRYYAL